MQANSFTGGVPGESSALAVGGESPPAVRLTELLEIQRDLAIELLWTTDLQQCLETLLTAALRLPGFDCGGTYLCDEVAGGVRLTSHRGLSDAFIQRVSWHPAGSRQEQMVQAGNLVYALSKELPPELAAILANEGLEAIAVLPLRANGRVVAALNVSSHRYPEIHPESRVALESIVALAEGTIELIEERKARQTAKRQLQLAVAGADLGTWAVDLDNLTLQVSERFRELHGLRPDEPATRDNIRATIHPADLGVLMAEIKRAMSGNPSFSIEYRTVDGKRWIASTGRVYADSGRQFFGVVRDITQTKETEHELRRARDQLEVHVAQRTAELATAMAALQDSASHLEMALNASQAGTWEHDMVAGTVHWDQRSRRMFGVPDDIELFHERIMNDRIHPMDRERLENRIAEFVAAGEETAWNQEFRISHPLLGERWILGLGQVELDANGLPCRMKGLNLDITDRKRIEQELGQSEAKYRALHQSMREAFVRTDLTGLILESNQAYRDLLGYTAEELSTKTYIELTPQRWHAFENQIIHEQVLQRDYSEVYEKEYICKNGAIVPVELRTFLIRDVAGQPHSFWAIVRDVTNRKATEAITRQWQQTLEQRLGERAQQLQQSEARFRQLAEATFEGIVISEGGIVLDGNPQLASMFGYELSEMIGRSMLDFVVPESRPEFTRRLLSQTEDAYEWTCLRKDGSEFPVVANPRLRWWQDRLVRITALRDLTESRRVAAAIHAQKAELEQAQRLALISEISAGIIHQISQPISTASAYVSVVLGNHKMCEQQSCQSLDVLNEIQEELTRVREIVIHLRALSDPEQPTRVRLDFNAMMTEILPLLQREASHRQIRLEIALAPVPLPLRADAVQLKQVVLNLTRNAFDACDNCPPSRRAVSIATRAIPSQGVELTVRDAGTGIDPADEHRLFSLFFTTKQEGRGIGLRLCRTIIQAHDGSIEAANNPSGIGAIFRVLLPADND